MKKNRNIAHPLFKNPPPSIIYHSRQAIINVARKHCPDIGDSASIAEGAWGYWVGASVYVSKEKIKATP